MNQSRLSELDNTSFVIQRIWVKNALGPAYTAAVSRVYRPMIGSAWTMCQPGDEDGPRAPRLSLIMATWGQKEVFPKGSRTNSPKKGGVTVCWAHTTLAAMLGATLMVRSTYQAKMFL